MNRYFVNQCKRSKESVVIKAIGFLALAVMPWKQRAIWKDHCKRMQRRLDLERLNGWGDRYIDGERVIWRNM